MQSSAISIVRLALLFGVIFQIVYSVNGENFYSEIEDLTPSQKKSLAAFKKAMLPELPQDYMKEDIYLYKYLKFNNFKVPKAQEHLKETLKWRQENNVEEILNNWPEEYVELNKEYPVLVGDGKDKEGRPICELPFGSWPVRKAAAAGIMKKLTLYLLISCAEKGIAKVREQQALGINITDYVAVVNMDGFSVAEHMCPSCLPLSINLASGNDRYFPLMAKGLYLINTPDTFATLFRLVRPIMSAPARASLKVLNTDPKMWKSFLDKRIDPTQLTDWMGGTKARAIQ